MRDIEKLRRLGQISALLQQSKMQALQRAALVRQESLARLAALDAPQPATDLPAVTAQEVALRYQVWADQRRSDINMGLARQTVAPNSCANLLYKTVVPKCYTNILY